MTQIQKNVIQALYCVSPISVRHLKKHIISIPNFEKTSRGNPCRFFFTLKTNSSPIRLNITLNVAMGL